MSMDRRRFLGNSTAAALGLGALPAGFPSAAAAGPAWAGDVHSSEKADRFGAITVQDWLDGFFGAYYARRPVNATFIGIHDHDHVLPDFSEQGAGDTLAEMEGLLRAVARLDPSPSRESVPTEAIDKRLAEGFLRIQTWEQGSHHFRLGNPTLYTGEAIFGPISLFLADFAPMSERVEAGTARMEGVAALLEQARENVRSAPAEWTVRAIRECEGARVFLTEGIDILAAENRITTPGFKTAAARAAAAFADFETHLETELLQRATDEHACGEEAFRLYLTAGHFVETDPEEIVRYAEEWAAEAQAELESGARALGSVDSTEALAGLSSAHPTADAYYERYEQVWDLVRDVVEEEELLTWPDPPLPIRYVARPAWARDAAPYLYFLSYRAPAAFGRPTMHDYLVRPIDASLPAERQEELLRATNDSVIKLNHVIHHGNLGHHVQNSHAYRSPSRIGQIAAVDCASRIAMFCGGTMAEGWASYSTDLHARGRSPHSPGGARRAEGAPAHVCPGGRGRASPPWPLHPRRGHRALRAGGGHDAGRGPRRGRQKQHVPRGGRHVHAGEGRDPSIEAGDGGAPGRPLQPSTLPRRPPVVRIHPGLSDRSLHEREGTMNLKPVGHVLSLVMIIAPNVSAQSPALGDGPWEFDTVNPSTRIRVSVITKALTRPWGLAVPAERRHPRDRKGRYAPDHS